MTIDLMQFCERNAMRLWMAEPFGVGKYTYASNGVILVRVPRSDWPSADLPEVVRPASFPQIRKWLNGSPAMAPIPAIPPGPYYEKCFMCSGSGEVQSDCGDIEECDECDGEGVIEKHTLTIAAFWQIVKNGSGNLSLFSATKNMERPLWRCSAGPSISRGRTARAVRPG